MNNSTSIKQLAESLSKFQSEVPAVQMNSVNPFLKNKYADLGAMIQTTRPYLAKNGLSVSQLVTSDGPNIGIETVLLHTSGEFISSTVTMFVGDEKGKSGAQVAGSIITYMRRYSFSAILGLYADEDTDGSHGQQASRPAANKPAQGNGNGKVEPTRDELIAKFNKYKVEAEALGIEVIPLEPNAEPEHIITRGKNLAAMINGRKPVTTKK